MTAAHADRCRNCGRPITVTTRNPNRRFCSPRCRAAHHRTRRSPTEPANAVTNAVRAPDDVTHAVRAAPDEDATRAVASAHAVPVANGVQRCPHCRAELAVIAVVVPATAAHVRTPEVIHTSPA
jgi:hypothetical protein